MTPEQLAVLRTLQGTCPGCIRKHTVLMGTGTIAGHSPKTPKYGGRNIPMKRLVMEGEPSGVWMCGGSFLPPLELAKSFYVIAKANRNEQ